MLAKTLVCPSRLSSLSFFPSSIFTCSVLFFSFSAFFSFPQEQEHRQDQRTEPGDNDLLRYCSQPERLQAESDVGEGPELHFSSPYEHRVVQPLGSKSAFRASRPLRQANRQSRYSGAFSAGEQKPLHPCLRALIDGPDEELHTLAMSSEPQIVRSYNPDSLGSVWAALAALQRPRDQSVSGDGEDEVEDEDARVPRRRQPPERYGNLVPTESIQFSSSPPGPRPPSSSSMGSIGYTENPQAPAVEDLTVRLVSSFIRYVFNYGQELRRPILEFRDERVTHASTTPSRWKLRAIDDGGVRILRDQEVGERESQHVALVEAKRHFQVIEEGRPTVSDRLLAQMAGEALASVLAPKNPAVSQSRQVQPTCYLPQC